MTIHIESLTIDAIIGILEHERLTPQTIIIDVQIDYDYTNHNFINYTDIVMQIESMIQKEQYELLEEALTHISTTIVDNYSQINSIFLKISKPNILPNTVVSVSKTLSVNTNQ